MMKGATKKEKAEPKSRKGEIGDIPGVTEPIRKYRSTGEMVFNALKSAIIGGFLKPGERLIEQRLSEKLKTSRIPVREAMRKLEQRGFVERLPSRGFRVSKTSREEAKETFGIRAALESYAASMATEYATLEFIIDLEKNVEASYQALAERDMERLTELNEQFHEMVYKAARSPRLYKMINAFRDYMARYRRPLFHTKSGGLASLHDHRRMLEAIKKGDKDQSRETRKETYIPRPRLRGKHDGAEKKAELQG